MSTINRQFDRLCRWIVDNGGAANGLSLSYCPGFKDCRTVIADKQFQAGEVMISIPQKLWIKGDHHILASLTISPTSKKIMHFIIEHRDPASFYRPYLDMLPPLSSFDNHPINALPIMRYMWHNISPAFVSMLDKLIDRRELIIEELSPFSVSRAEIIYTFFILITRAWDNFIPLADMFQHNDYANIGHVEGNIVGSSSSSSSSDNSDNSDNSFFIIKAHRPYQLGDEMFDNYGHKDNVALLSMYNFTTNPGVMPCSFTLQTPYLEDERLYILSRCPTETPMITIAGMNKILIYLLYLATLTKQEIEELKRDNGEYYRHVLDNTAKSLKLSSAISVDHRAAVINTGRDFIDNVASTICLSAKKCKKYKRSYKDRVSQLLLTAIVNQHKMITKCRKQLARLARV